MCVLTSYNLKKGEIVYRDYDQHVTFFFFSFFDEMNKKTLKFYFGIAFRAYLSWELRPHF